MDEKLKRLCDNNGRDVARCLFVTQRLMVRIPEAHLDSSNFDLGSRSQLNAICEQVQQDVINEGFNECTKEEIYLSWIMHMVFDETPSLNCPLRKPEPEELCNVCQVTHSTCSNNPNCPCCRADFE